MTIMKTYFAIAIFAIVFATGGNATAGEQYVDKTGFAVSGYDVVSYFSLGNVSALQSRPQPLAGKKSITAEYNGATWSFATEANKAAFLANPGKYAPQYDGHCVYGVAQGAKVPSNPYLWSIIDDRLYLNITKWIDLKFKWDVDGNLAKAKANWSKLEPKPANRDKVPDFDTSQAPAG